KPRPGWITARNRRIPPWENGGKRGWLAGSSGLSPRGASRTINPHPGGIGGDETGGDGDRSAARFAGAGCRHFIHRTALQRKARAMTDDHHRFHLHLVSDATGETINNVARACLVQFEEIEPIDHTCSLIRTSGQ